MASKKEEITGKKKIAASPSGFFAQGKNISPVIVAVGLGIAAIYPITLSGYAQFSVAIYAVYFMWIALAESWNLVGGFAGLLNLGLGAFFILGSVIASLAMAVGAPFLLSMLVAGSAGLLFALVLIPTFRLRSDYFAIGTLVIPIIMRPLVEYFTGKTSFNFPDSDVLQPVPFYYVGLAMSALAIFGTYFLMRSRVGIALRALGDDESASASLGVNTILYKTVALALSGFVAAVAGAYFLQLVGSVSTTGFDNLSYSLFPIFMVIIGGSGTFEGPIIGSVIFSVVDYSFTNYFKNTNFDVLFFSVVIMIVAVLLPRGIVPFVKRKIVPLIVRANKHSLFHRSHGQQA
jgi:branched-chain amino acid transport system permease protein